MVCLEAIIIKISINHLKILTVLLLFFSISSCNSNSSNTKNKDGGGPEDEIVAYIAWQLPSGGEWKQYSYLTLKAV